MPIVRSRLLPQLLGVLPRRLLALLDDWARREAQARAERRRQRIR